MNTCAIDDCSKPTRRGRAVLCAMHYHRQYRHGDVHATAAGITTGLGRRYTKRYQPNHPLATKDGTLYTHRAVLYDFIGPGPHPCHWCDTTVYWDHPMGDPHQLQVDHLDSDGANNEPSNLVPACPPCNAGRGSARRHRTLVAAGLWSAHDTVASLGTRLDPTRFNDEPAQQPGLF
jgi:hypothetical protein